MQRDTSDNYIVRGEISSLGERDTQNSEALMKSSEALCRLRQVSELRLCL